MLQVINFTKNAHNMYIDEVDGVVKALTVPATFNPGLASEMPNKIYRIERQIQE